MIEVLKQVVMTLDFLLYGDNPDYDEACKTLEVGKHAIAELESQEPVALPCCGYTDASAVKWNPLNGVVQCHNCGQTYTHPPQRTEPVDYEKLAALGWQAIQCGICGGGAMGYPQRTWVGLTDDEMFELWLSADEQKDHMAFGKAVEAKLKEKNI